ncbi:hypothetical protein LEP48_10610 [Isoptericola sp. NEAU-Y5]|uniref:Uncharacterized protein n=1 Tax=Isoptericola luteus TaxID=2879484 RepID=A0ABS7ZFJ8_9MICO|nr:hypothetical protein [Isoptericola sp. NEAU-Y5]MCA5893798.1 hypothetical protein [Isoptericola sp. NEAU-Y5]
MGAGDPHAARRLRRRPREAFTAALTTGDETADGGLHWLGRADVLAPWLGDRTPA